MGQYFTHLQLPFEPDMEELSVFETNPHKLAHVLRSIDQVDPRLLDLFTDLGISISHAEAFYTPPFAKLAIHADSPRFGDHSKLNFCYGGGLMNWWELKDKNLQPPVKTTGINTQYIYLEMEQCRMVASTRIRRPTIVNVGRPHSVINQTGQGRYVGSLVLNDKLTQELLTIFEATERLKQYENL